jgi:ABC-type nickel/cobalt efflux system permease component RcnA
MQMNRDATLAIAGAVALTLYLWADPAFAQGSLGLGRPEQAIQPTGLFAPLLFWLKAQQTWFYQLMRGELLALRTDASRIWLLAGLSFGYGIFHAAGPGHGKAVISSYMIANEVAARRGIVLSFASAFAQALTAIAVVAALTLLLRGAGMRQQDMTAWLEIASYGAITLLGAWLLWMKLFRGGDGHGHGAHHRQKHAHAHGHAHGHDHVHGPDCDHGHHGAAEHSHAPDPALLTGKVGLRQAWTAIVAVGLRPCSGALIVLTFAFLNGLYFAGLASVGAMAIGTGVTVALLAALAVWAKDVAIRVGGAADRAALVHRFAEIAGAAFVFLIGATLLAASLA